MLMGSHETSRKTAHPSPNVPASAFRPFQFRVLFPGESHLWRTERTLCCGPRTDQTTCACRHHSQGQLGPRGCPLLKSSQAPAFLTPFSELWGARFAALPAPSEHLALVLARGWGAEEKLLFWLWAKHYIQQGCPISWLQVLWEAR